MFTVMSLSVDGPSDFRLSDRTPAVQSARSGLVPAAAAALLHFTLRRTVTYFSCTLALITKWRYYFLPSPYQLLWVIHNGPE